MAPTITIRRDLVVALHRDQAAHDAVDQQRHQDRRKGELDVGDAHDHGVDGAAEVAAHQAERDAQHHGEDHRCECRPRATGACRT